MNKSEKEEKIFPKPTQADKKTAAADKKDGKGLKENKSHLPFGRAVKEDPRWQKRIILFTVSLLAALCISPGGTPSIRYYKVGDIARHNIKAPGDFLVEDIPSTIKKKKEAEAASLSVYDFDDGASKDTARRISSAFSLMRQHLAEIDSNAKTASTDDSKMEGKKFNAAPEIRAAYLEASREERRQAFEGELFVKVDENDFMFLEGMSFSAEIESYLKEAMTPIIEAGIVDSKELLLPEKDRGITVRNVVNRKEKVITDISVFIDINEARTAMAERLTPLLKGWKNGGIKILTGLAGQMMKPNLTFNRNETEKRKAEALEAASPVYFQVKEGEMILREGERATEDHLLKLEVLSGRIENQTVIIRFIGMFFLVAVFTYSLYHFSVQNIRKIKFVTKDLIFLSITLITTLIFFRLSIPVTEAMQNAFPFIPPASYRFLFTAAAISMLVRVVLNSEVALVFSVALSVMAALMMKNNLAFAIFTLIGCIAGSQMVRQCKYRVVLIKAGFYVGLVNAAIVVILGLVSGDLFVMDYAFSPLFGFIGGALSGVIVIGLTPVVEGIFGYTTNFKLLELASLDHPLLKELITQSPGTYHHSWIIGNLVENAAESIRANPLLARVSALYHDIGKMKKPQYFFENQQGGKNPHDKLAPSLSSLILIGHVKDGIELAREYRLGKAITDIIPQHHGTRLIRFFYQKAKDQEDPDVHEVNEKDFRYPGPKPQTKEAGLVMLADAVEAASRTIQDPTPARIQAVVKKIISEIFADGQLDECELTLKDLNQIANSFNRVLNGIFHARIDYPDADEDKGKTGKEANGTDQRKKENEGSRQARDKKNCSADSASLAIQWC